MNIYDLIFEELQSRVDSGELTLEQANEVNDLAYEKYVSESSFENFKKYANEDRNISYFNYIKDNKNFLIKRLNKCSEEAFKKFKDYMTSSWKGHETDSYGKYELEKVEEFYKRNKKYPTVSNDWNWDNDYISFSFKTNDEKDVDLFYQDFVMKYINKDKELKEKGFSFSSDDYIGISIHVK